MASVTPLKVGIAEMTDIKCPTPSDKRVTNLARFRAASFAMTVLDRLPMAIMTSCST